MIPCFEKHVGILHVPDSPEDESPVEVAVVKSEAEMPLDRDGGVGLDRNFVQAEVVERRLWKARLVLLGDAEEAGHAISRKEIAENRI